MHEFTGGEFLIIGIPGDELDAQTDKLIQTIQPSGFILFVRNIKTPQQLRELTDALRLRVHHEPIITIDQEGGRVSRLKEFMSEPPGAKQLSLRGDLSLIQRHGQTTGQLLRLFGFNLNLAPVLDIELDTNNDNSLKERSYGFNVDQVTANARAFAQAMTSQGILSCGKHFPGYSGATVDPHHKMPVVSRTFEDMIACEWLPFKRLAPELDLVMVGHVAYPNIDPTAVPATLSPHMVRKVLRGKIGFSGCTITDDMDMGAVSGGYSPAEAAALALEAGNDFMLVCHNFAGIPEIAAALRGTPSDIRLEAYDRIMKVRQRLVVPEQFSMHRFQRLDEAVSRLRAATLNHQAAQALTDVQHR